MTLRTFSIIVFAWSLVMMVVLGGMLAAESIYDRAVAECATHDATPAGIENRLTYVCVTPEGMTITP